LISLFKVIALPTIVIVRKSDNIAIAIVGRVINIEREIQKRSKEPTQRLKQ